MQYNFKTLSHDGIQSLSPYIPGKSIEEVQKELGITDIIKLASNENFLGCSNNVMRALSNISVQDISLYHTSGNHNFRGQLAHFLGVSEDMLALSNGSDLIICLLMICFGVNNNKHILTHEYAFISYEIQAKTLGIPVVHTKTQNWQVDIDDMINQCNEKTALIFLANPNNPTGTLISHSEIKRLLQSIPSKTIVVLDEAYFEYAKSDYKDNSIDLINEHPNLVIIRTFSKAYGLAGLRLGYAIANPEIIQLLYNIQLPFSVNIAALTAASAALSDQDFINTTIELTKQGMQQMQDGLNALNYSFIPCYTNFITIDCKRDGVEFVKALEKTGIIVRPLHPYKMNNYLRVTIGSKEQNSRFLNALSKI
jgi:histidinol-phosphate aminotransferase